MIVRCVICNKILKDPESRDRGLGSICAQKVDDAAKQQIRYIIAIGYQPMMLGDRAIGLTIPERDDERA